MSSGDKINKIVKLVFILSVACILTSVIGYIIGGRVFESIYGGIIGIVWVLWMKKKLKKKVK